MSFARPQPFESTYQDKLFGVLIILGLGIVILLALLNGDETSASDKTRYVTQLTQAFGVKTGASVSISGVNIGTITAVDLTDTAQVIVTISLENEYSKFYTLGSQLIVQSSIGLDSVLSGVGFLFQSGGVDQPALEPGSRIEAVEPKSIEQMLNDWDVESVAADIKNIISNLDKAVAVVAENQQNLSNTLVDTTRLVKSLAQSAEKLPVMLDNINGVATNTNKLIGNLDNNLQQSNQQVAALLENAQNVTQQMDLVLQNVDKTTQSTPELVESLNLISQRTAVLVNKLNNHWLLGSRVEQNTRPGQALRIYDQQLYQHITPDQSKGNN